MKISSYFAGSPEIRNIRVRPALEGEKGGVTRSGKKTNEVTIVTENNRAITYYEPSSDHA